MLDPTYAQHTLFMVIFTVIAIGFAVAPLMLQYLVSPKKASTIKNTAYECGLESSGDSWMRFRVQYYLCALLFVIFDVEVVFIYPWAVALHRLGIYALVEMGIFVGILALALGYAWKKGVLEW
jgi:NADH-quinone oxidoreductase subunit A